MTAPDRIILYRRIMADNWHLSGDGETMSHGNAEYADYIRADAPPEAFAALPHVQALVESGTRALALLRADGRGDADIAMSLAADIRAMQGEPPAALIDDAARAGKGE